MSVKRPATPTEDRTGKFLRVDTLMDDMMISDMVIRNMEEEIATLKSEVARLKLLMQAYGPPIIDLTASEDDYAGWFSTDDEEDLEGLDLLAGLL